MTGYPSKDKPWLKYYSREAINSSLPECTLYEYAWEKNKNRLTDIVLEYYGTRITYDYFFKQIRQAADAFSSAGIQSGDVVTIMSLCTPETIISIYALNYIGAVANMVYITLSEKEIINTLEKTHSRMLIILDISLSQITSIKTAIKCPIMVIGVYDSLPIHLKLVYKLKNRANKHYFISWESFLTQVSLKAVQNHDFTKSAVIVYTSGSTGDPKGVELSSFNINSVAFQYQYVDVSIESGDTSLVFIPPFFSIGICYLHIPLCLGCRLIICVNPEPLNVIKEFLKNKPNHFVAAPSNALMLTEKVINLKFLKSFGAGGEAVPKETEKKINQWLEKNNAKVYFSVGYGMTEFSGTIVLNSNSVRKENTLGVPLVKTLAKVVDVDTGMELKYNQVGELCFHTPSQMNGYIGHNEENRRIIEDSGDGIKWIHTGDLGFIDEGGFIHYSGRIKRIFMTKVGSSKDAVLMKMFPQRMEECINNIKFVKCAGVIVKEHEERIHIPIAFVVLNDHTISEEKAVRQITKSIRSELPEQEWPEAIHIIDQMPLTLNGKIDYHALECNAQSDGKDGK